MNRIQCKSALGAGRLWLLVAIIGVMLCSAAQAQAVYRCEAKGKVSYSNEPCIGATVVDTTPTQGLDKSTGVSRVGRDVQRERFKKSINEAMRPLTGMSHEEVKVFERRRKLSTGVKLECQWLDVSMPEQAAAAKRADAQSREKAETELFLSRSRFRNLGC
jgi:hypothetical protein